MAFQAQLILHLSLNSRRIYPYFVHAVHILDKIWQDSQINMAILHDHFQK